MKKLKRCLNTQFTIALLALAAAGPAHGVTTMFQEGVSPTGGYVMGATYIRSTDPTGNQNGDTDLELIFGTTASGDVIRGLLEFDISAIPAADLIQASSLVLTTHSDTGLDQGGETGDPTFNVHSYGFDFDETSATWNAPGTGDATAGGTLGTLLSSASFDPMSTGMEVTFASTPAFQSAVSDALAGDGFLRLIIAKDDESTVSTHEFTRIAADSFGTAGSRPELVITHIPEPSRALLLLLGGLALISRRRR